MRVLNFFKLTQYTVCDDIRKTCVCPAELETAAALYNAACVEPATMAAAIGRLVNGKFTATILAPRLDSLELAVDRGKMSEEVLGRLRDRIGVRSASVAASRSGFLQICVDR